MEQTKDVRVVTKELLGSWRKHIVIQDAGHTFDDPSDTRKKGFIVHFLSSVGISCDLVLRIACLQSSALLYYMSLWKVSNTANLCVCRCACTFIFYRVSVS